MSENFVSIDAAELSNARRHLQVGMTLKAVANSSLAVVAPVFMALGGAAFYADKFSTYSPGQIIHSMIPLIGGLAAPVGGSFAAAAIVTKSLKRLELTVSDQSSMKSLLTRSTIGSVSAGAVVALPVIVVNTAFVAPDLAQKILDQASLTPENAIKFMAISAAVIAYTAIRGVARTISKAGKIPARLAKPALQ